jgi:tryptophanyl-tRNA synthetase
MGKSLGNAIYLVDDEETINKKIMGAITDPNKIKKDDPANPDICMVYYYHKLVNDEESCSHICSECKQGARGCVQCKKELITKMNEFLAPVKAKRKQYEDNPELLRSILEEGTIAAQEKAKEQVKKIKEAMKINY